MPTPDRIAFVVAEDQGVVPFHDLGLGFCVGFEEKRRAGARLLREVVLRGFVADGATELFRDLWWNFSHVVDCARVFCGLLQDVLCGLTPHYKVAVDANVFAADYFCHVNLRHVTYSWPGTQAEV